MLTPNDPVPGSPRLSVDAFLRLVRVPIGNAEERFFRSLWRWCEAARIDPVIPAIQAFLETANFESERWRRGWNAGGFLIEGASDQDPPIASPEEAGRVFAWMLAIACRLNTAADIEPLSPNLKPLVERWWNKFRMRGVPTVRTVADLQARYVDASGEPQATWAWDDQYATKLQSRANAVVPDLPGVKQPMRELTITRLMMPRTNHNFPGQTLQYRELGITVHETGNDSPDADARMHANFVYNGGGEHSVCFHFAVDDKGAYQMMPLDQLAWHAGDGCDSVSADYGCFGTIAIETCINRGGNWQKTLANLETLIAAILLGDRQIDYGTVSHRQFSAGRLYRHIDWMRKNCPTRINDSGYFPTLTRNVQALVAGVTPVETGYANPLVYSFLKQEALDEGINRNLNGAVLIACRRQWTPARKTARQRTASLAKNPPVIGPPLEKGEVFLGEFIFRSGGAWWILTRWGTRVRMADMTERLEPAGTFEGTP